MDCEYTIDPGEPRADDLIRASVDRIVAVTTRGGTFVGRLMTVGDAVVRVATADRIALIRRDAVVRVAVY